MKKHGFGLLMVSLLVLAGVSVDTWAEELWVARYDNLTQWDQAEFIEVDDSGDAYVTGFSGSDWVTVKYGSDGTEQWSARYAPGTRPRDMAVDGAGNVYVTGFTSNYDCVVIKYSSDGVEQWTGRYAGPFGRTDSGRAVAVDGAGNVYVAGYSYGGYDTHDDWVTIKYDSDGVEQWAVRYDGPLGTDWGSGKYWSKSDRPVDIAVDAAGDVYVTGTSMAWTGTYSRINHSDVTTIKYNSSGTMLWEARYDGPSQWGTWDHAWDTPYALELDSDGNVYIAGQTSRQFTGDREDGDWLVLKYDSGGIQQWVVVYDEAVDDLARDLAVDASGNVYVAGYSDDEDAEEVVWLVANYNGSGAQQWMRRYHGSANNASALALDLDASGNVYVAGITYDPSGYYNYDWMTIKYDSTGNEQWQEPYGGSASTRDHALDIAVDGSGNAYVTGYSKHDTNADFTTIKYGDSAPDDDGDVDGIHNDVDTLPGTPSDDFSDGTTTGTITDRGDQVLTVTDSVDPDEGVTVAADPAGGAAPATVSVCGGSADLSFTPDDVAVVTCGSVTVTVISGTVEIEFQVEDAPPVTTSLLAGNSLTFEPTGFSVTAAPTNSDIVIILVYGEEMALAPGQAVSSMIVDLEKAKVSWNHGNISLNGKLYLPEGLRPDDLDPAGSALIQLAGIEVAGQNVEFEIKGKKTDKWEYKDKKNLYGNIKELKIDWKGAKFDYRGDDGFRIHTHSIDADETILCVHIGHASGSLVVTVNGTTIAYNEEWNITTDVIYEPQKRDNSHVHFTLPFRLTADMSVDINEVTAYTIEVGTHFREDYAKFKVNAIFEPGLDPEPLPALLKFIISLHQTVIGSDLIGVEKSWTKMDHKHWQYD